MVEKMICASYTIKNENIQKQNMDVNKKNRLILLRIKRFVLVDDTRLELVTSRTSSGCATSCANRPGGDKRDRTADLLNAIQALSQLSYTPP